MAIVRAGSLEEAERLAHDDPSIGSGFLGVRVRPWLAAMGSERFQLP